MSDSILGPGDIADLLCTNAIKQFHAEQRKAEITNGRMPEEMSAEELQEVGRLGVEIGALNNRRVAFKNELNRMFGQGLVERKLFYIGGGVAKEG